MQPNGREKDSGRDAREPLLDRHGERQNEYRIQVNQYPEFHNQEHYNRMISHQRPVSRAEPYQHRPDRRMVASQQSYTYPRPQPQSQPQAQPLQPQIIYQEEPACYWAGRLPNKAPNCQFQWHCQRCGREELTQYRARGRFWLFLLFLIFFFSAPFLRIPRRRHAPRHMQEHVQMMSVAIGILFLVLYFCCKRRIHKCGFCREKIHFDGKSNYRR